MRVKINGKVEEVEQTTLAGLLHAKNIELRMVAIEHNGQMIDRAVLEQTQIVEGDEIEILFFMGGGCTTA